MVNYIFIETVRFISLEPEQFIILNDKKMPTIHDNHWAAGSYECNQMQTLFSHELFWWNLSCFMTSLEEYHNFIAFYNTAYWTAVVLALTFIFKYIIAICYVIAIKQDT